MKFKFDLAAHLFSYLQTPTRSNVFQLCAEFHAPVDVHRLNHAITRTAPYFPAMMVQRKTSMWDDWLESCDSLPKAVYWPNLPRYFCDMERLSQCAVQILYDQTHIAVVFSHYVTDGSGGCAFFEHLLHEYVQGFSIQKTVIPSYAFTEDAYRICEGPETTTPSSVYHKAFQLSEGQIEGEILSTHLHCPVSSLKRAAHRYHATINQFLTAALMLAIERVRKKKGRPIRLMIPLDLRKILTNDTQRNFTLYIAAEEPNREDLQVNEVIAQLQESQDAQTDAQLLKARIQANLRLEQHFFWRLLPFPIKCALLQFVHKNWVERQFTMTFSNLGLFSPETSTSYIKKMNFMLTPLRSGRYNCSCISCNGLLVLSFVRTIRQPMIERELVQVLSELGVEVSCS